MNRSVTFAFVCLLILPASALAQTRSRTTKPSTRTAKATAAAADEIRNQAAAKVADKIKQLTQFVYVLGGVAKGIEQVDQAVAKNEGSPAVVDQNNKSKASVKSSLENVRAGLDQLEVYFRGTPEVEGYYLKLAGSASGAATAEDLAAAGRFDQAGRTLLGVINRLTDVLLAMR